jgi:hypothetical protein
MHMPRASLRVAGSRCAQAVPIVQQIGAMLDPTATRSARPRTRSLAARARAHRALLVLAARRAARAGSDAGYSYGSRSVGRSEETSYSSGITIQSTT